MANKDYYATLEIPKGSDEKAVKKAYRKLAKKYHPDANPGDKAAEAKFKEVTEAYNILSDPEKKKMYDTYGSAAFEEGFGQGGFGGFGGGGQEFHFNGNGMNMDDLFGGMFGSFFHQGGGQQGGFGGGQGGYGGFGGQAAPEKGSNITHEINISFRDAAFGCDRQMRLNGSGGSVNTVKVHIPAGIDEGQSVRLRGKGNPGYNGGAAGDLMLKVHIIPEKGLRREGMDVYQDIQIPFTTAVFGGTAVIETLQGKVQVNVPAGIQTGAKMKLRGKGIVSMKNSSEYGDTYAVIGIKVPQYLSDEAKKKLEEIAHELQ